MTMSEKKQEAVMRDICAAAAALLDWMYSQEINPPDGVPVLCVALTSLIEACAVKYDKNPHELRCGAISLILRAGDFMDMKEE
jgi:hypothetical protein